MPYIEMTLEEAIRYVKAGLIDPNDDTQIVSLYRGRYGSGRQVLPYEV